MTYKLATFAPHNDVKLVFTKEDLDKIVEELVEESTPQTAEIDSKVELSTRERNTLLLVIGALAEKAKYDLNDRDTVGKLERLLERQGTPVGVKTLRKIKKDILDVVELKQK